MSNHEVVVVGREGQGSAVLYWLSEELQLPGLRCLRAERAHVVADSSQGYKMIGVGQRVER